jgi:Carboxypeptidase regulatory-like domain
VRHADTHVLLRYASGMPPRFLSSGLLLVTSLAVCPVWGQQTATRAVTISVSDPTGTGVAHAQIRLVPTPDSAAAKLETDAQGRLAVNLKPATYALFVSAQGFKAATRRFAVTEPVAGETNSPARQSVPVTLQVAAPGGPVTVYPQDSLVLTADAYHAPVALSPAEFRALPHVTVTVHNAHTDADETYSGVALATLLAMINAPIGKELHGESLATYLVATGTDGYSVVLSLAEADPSFHDGQILVADALDGKPLGQSGPYKLVVSADMRPTRWVRNLDSIALQDAHGLLGQN